MNKLFDWFFTTRLGEVYFSFLLWLDRRKDSDRYLTPSEVAQITRQYSMLDRGVVEIKRKINSLVKAKTAEEYRQTLASIEDLAALATYAPGSPEAQMVEVLRAIKAPKITKDFNTHTGRALVIEQRIEDYKLLQGHVEKRQLTRELRKAKQIGNEELFQKLQTEWNEKYGK